MRMIDRLTSLVRSNVNEALDHAEDPEKVLAQILREMLTSITTARTQVITLIAQEKELEAEVEQSRQAAANWERKAQAAVASGNDNLAREALKRKRDAESIGGVYQQQLTTHQQVVARFRRQLRQLESKYQTTLAQRDVLIARHKRAIAQAEITKSLSQLPSADPSAGLERMERNIRSREAQVAAYTELADNAFDAQFAALEDPTIEAELLELKAKTFGKPEADSISLEEFRDLEPFDIEAELRELKSGL